MTHVHRGIVGRRVNAILNNKVINEYESRWTNNRETVSHCHIQA